MRKILFVLLVFGLLFSLSASALAQTPEALYWASDVSWCTSDWYCWKGREALGPSDFRAARVTGATDCGVWGLGKWEFEVPHASQGAIRIKAKDVWFTGTTNGHIDVYDEFGILVAREFYGNYNLPPLNVWGVLYFNDLERSMKYVQVHNDVCPSEGVGAQIEVDSIYTTD